MDDNISKGLFGLNRKEVESYISDLKHGYEEELSKQDEMLQTLKAENTKLNERLNQFLNDKREMEVAKQNISDVLFKAEEQAKQIIEDAKTKAEDERKELDVILEQEKEKLIDAKLELAMLKDKAREIMMKFTDDITKLQ
jgi:cell division initiation protein